MDILVRYVWFPNACLTEPLNVGCCAGIIFFVVLLMQKSDNIFQSI